MCSAVYHTFSFQGDHRNTNYICTIWDKSILQNAADRGSADGIEPIFEQVVRKGFEPAVILFPCPGEMHATIFMIGSRDLEFCASQTYRLTKGQETVNLVFTKTLNGFGLSQNSNTRVLALEVPFR